MEEHIFNRKLKPIFVVADDQVGAAVRGAAIDGIQQVLQEARMEGRIKIRDFGAWRSKGYLKEGALTEYGSVDWYLNHGRMHSHRAGQLNVEAMNILFVKEPWQQVEPHYDVMIVSHDLNTYDRNINFVLGCTRPRISCVISTWRFRDLEQSIRDELFKTAVMHEVGHLFDLPKATRTDLELNLGRHCQNRCIMRQRLALNGWFELTQDRFSRGPFCEECLDDLRAYLP